MNKNKFFLLIIIIILIIVSIIFISNIINEPENIDEDDPIIENDISLFLGKWNDLFYSSDPLIIMIIYFRRKRWL